MSRLKKVGLATLLVIVLVAVAVVALRDPSLITLSANDGDIDWKATLRQLLDGDFGFVKGRGRVDPDRFLILHPWDAGVITVDPLTRAAGGGHIIRLGDREELNLRLGEGFEARFRRRLGGLFCGETLAWEQTNTRLTSTVIARPRQFYFVLRKYGPRSTKNGKTEAAVIEVLSHDLVHRVLTLRRYPVNHD